MLGGDIEASRNFRGEFRLLIIYCYKKTTNRAEKKFNDNESILKLINFICFSKRGKMGIKCEVDLDELFFFKCGNLPQYRRSDTPI